MMPLLDVPIRNLAERAAELGMTEYGQLLTSNTRHTCWDGVYAIDNGAFGKHGFEEARFLSLLNRQKPARDRCLFVAAPDVVGSARRTMETFRHWFPKLSGWPVALVAQDGIEDMEIPWRLLSAVFIGGSTEWKMSRHAEAVIRAAKIIGKHVHVGRLNTIGRWRHFEAMGVDTCDGTGLCLPGGSYAEERKLIRLGLSEPQLPYVEQEANYD